MMTISAFQEHVGMKFQIYNGLFLNLPFPDVKASGILLPVFTSFCEEALEEGRSPIELVEEFFAKRVGTGNFSELKDDLFRFLRLAERQVVLFDALEDSAFTRIVDTQGPGSVKDTLNRIERSEQIDEFEKLLEQYRVRIVLTAHPTQFYTDQVLGILLDLVDSLRANDLQEINRLLLQMGNTRFKKKNKPSPLDEAESLMWILENVMFSVIPRIHSQLTAELCRDRIKSLQLPGIIELGFWPGGDRDGNPFVTHDITTEVGSMLRRSILKLYLREARTLLRRLTFDGVMNRMEQVCERLESTINPAGRQLERIKPYDEESTGKRVIHLEVSDNGYHGAEELLEDLFAIREILHGHHRGLFTELLDSLIFRVQCFGFHFASLDVRQDSSVHRSLMGQLASMEDIFALPDGIPAYEDMDEDSRISYLNRCLESWAGLPSHEQLRIREQLLSRITDNLFADCLLSFRAIREIQADNGIRGAHRYIISHTEQASDLLEVRLLGMLGAFDSGAMPVDIVPLFETIDDLHNAPAIMKQLFSDRGYRSHVEARGGRQNIMLGFSDGTKDGGYVTANWEIYKAKEELTRVCSSEGFRVTFFDGRGGPPARGGGNTHKFYRGLGRHIDSTSIHLTIQGQTISSSYGTEDLASHNLGQLVSSGIENNLFPADSVNLSPEDRELIQKLSDLANGHYLKLRNHPRFISYLEEMTPLRYYGRTNIGSRPTRRKSNAPLSLDSLRAIPFVGAWSQMKQNIPGYYGLGTALSTLIKEGREDELSRLYHSSLFFRTLMENSMMSLSKSFFPLTAYIERDPVYGEFWTILEQEARLSREMLSRISGQSEMLSSDPVNRESIRMRERLILPVLVIQQYAMQKIRQLENGHDQQDAESGNPAQKAGVPLRFQEDDRTAQKETLEKLIIKSLMASINASRNSV